MVCLDFKKGKESLMFQGWFNDMFREQVNLFYKPNNPLNLQQFDKKL